MAESHQTLVGLDPISSLCTTGHPANVMTGILLRLLQEHFASPLGLEYNGVNEPGPRSLENYIWTNVVETTRIQILPVWLYNPQDIQRRPGLYVKRNGLKPERLGIDDGFTTAPVRNPDGTIQRIPGEYKSKLIIGSHTVFCVGGTGAEAELLGMEVFNHFDQFGSVIRRNMNMHRFGVTEVGEVSLLDEFDQHFVVPVVCGHAVASAWRIDVVAPWLKTLAIDIRT